MEEVDSITKCIECSHVAAKMAKPDVKRNQPASWQTVKSYVSRSGGVLNLVAVLVLFLLFIGSTTFSNWWLSYWLSNTSVEVKLQIKRNYIYS